MGIIDKVIGNPNSSTENPTNTSAKKKVLIVEDDQYLKDFYQELLTSAGYDVLTAVNGQEGLEKVVAQKPSLILLDIMMPVMDGKSMLHKMREIEEFKYTPVIILTNAGDADNMKQTMRYDNANAFLIKSNITPDELLSAVKNFV
jgi:DNA-binding response OmpR family regulator